MFKSDSRSKFFSKNPLKHGNDSGMSLISVMVAVGVGGIMAVVFSQMMTNAQKSQKHLELSGDKEAIKRMLLTRVSCNESLGATGECGTKSGIISLKDDDGKMIVGAATNGTKLGDWTIRALCNKDKGVSVEVARLKPGKTINSTNKNDFFPNPLTNKVDVWGTEDAKLFPVQLNFCTPGTQTMNLLSIEKFRLGASTMISKNKNIRPIGHFDFVTKGTSVRISTLSSIRVAGENALGEILMEVENITAKKIVRQKKAIQSLWGISNTQSLMTQASYSDFIKTAKNQKFRVKFYLRSDDQTKYQSGASGKIEVTYHSSDQLEATVETWR